MQYLKSLLRIPYKYLIRYPQDLIRFFVELTRERNDPRYVNSLSSYILMRELYVISGGYLFALFNRYVAGKGQPKKSFESGIKMLPRQDTLVLDQVTNMKCHVAGNLETIGTIEDFAYVDVGRVEVIPQQLYANKLVAKLVTSDLWISEVQNIIGTEPVALNITAWWSKPTSNDKAVLSNAAQLWHRDLDRLRDIKIFLYATEVGDKNGPFEYIEGSHLASLRALSTNTGRYDDGWVQSRYPNRVVSMKGVAGTTFLVDTQGMHRGRPVERGLRCVLVAYFSSSLFGAESQYLPRIALDPTWASYPVWKEAIERNPQIWGSLFN